MSTPTTFTQVDPDRPEPAPSRRRPGWIVAGIALLVIAAVQLTLLPEWLIDDEHGLVGHLTGVVSLIAVGVALLVTGRERRP